MSFESSRTQPTEADQPKTTLSLREKAAQARAEQGKKVAENSAAFKSKAESETAKIKERADSESPQETIARTKAQYNERKLQTMKDTAKARLEILRDANKRKVDIINKEDTAIGRSAKELELRGGVVDSEASREMAKDALAQFDRRDAEEETGVIAPQGERNKSLEVDMEATQDGIPVPLEEYDESKDAILEFEQDGIPVPQGERDKSLEVDMEATQDGIPYGEGPRDENKEVTMEEEVPFGGRNQIIRPEISDEQGRLAMLGEEFDKANGEVQNLAEELKTKFGYDVETDSPGLWPFGEKKKLIKAHQKALKERDSIRTNIGEVKNAEEKIAPVYQHGTRMTLKDGPMPTAEQAAHALSPDLEVMENNRIDTANIQALADAVDKSGLSEWGTGAQLIATEQGFIDDANKIEADKIEAQNSLGFFARRKQIKLLNRDLDELNRQKAVHEAKKAEIADMLQSSGNVAPRVFTGKGDYVGSGRPEITGQVAQEVKASMPTAEQLEGISSLDDARKKKEANARKANNQQNSATG